MECRSINSYKFMDRIPALSPLPTENESSTQALHTEPQNRTHSLLIGPGGFPSNCPFHIVIESPCPVFSCSVPTELHPYERKVEFST